MDGAAMPERRRERRPGAADRRSFPRPPLWLNIALLLVAILGAGAAKLHRDRLDTQFNALLHQNDSTPAEMARLRSELSGLNLTREELARELDSRLKYMEGQQSERFYLALDTTRRKLILHYGEDIVREADLQVGPPATLEAPDGRSWTFVPLKGAFTVRGKDSGGSWQVQPWVYVLNGEPVPAARPAIAGGLGRYVVHLPNNYVIHSPPAEESPLRGPKPGSFMVPEEDLRAIWPRIDKNTRVFIF
jgi:hypothetical protein